MRGPTRSPSAARRFVRGRSFAAWGRAAWWFALGVALGTTSVAGAAVAALQIPTPERERPRAVVGDLVLEAPEGWEAQLEQMAAAARELVPRLEEDLGHGTDGPYRIFLLPPRSQLDPELVRLDELAPRWASGFLIGSYRVGAIRLQQVRRYPVDDAVEVLAHEITHMILHDAAGGNLPRWFSEGVATWEGRRRGLRDLAVTTASLLMTDPPPLAELDRELDASPARARRAYATSFAFVSWSVRRHGVDLVPRLLDRLDEMSLEDAWREATGESLSAEERRWRRRALWIHRWIPALAGSGSLWVLITVLFLLAAAARRRRTLALYRRWAEEEAGIARIDDELGLEPPGVARPAEGERRDGGGAASPDPRAEDDTTRWTVH
ncbi:MAG TPA: hypothetical protein VMV46_00055 [Thermoanaerobaculia bacterium]|nr:hypothetical protein [Thermoanaerobaculia bacterium]